jgi:hypothetical protein
MIENILGARYPNRRGNSPYFRAGILWFGVSTGHFRHRNHHPVPSRLQRFHLGPEIPPIGGLRIEHEEQRGRTLVRGSLIFLAVLVGFETPGGTQVSYQVFFWKQLDKVRRMAGKHYYCR